LLPARHANIMDRSTKIEVVACPGGLEDDEEAQKSWTSRPDHPVSRGCLGRIFTPALLQGRLRQHTWWHRLYHPGSQIICNAAMAFMFLIIGIVLLTASGGVNEIAVSYSATGTHTITVEEAWQGPVYLYYELDGFHANLRSMVSVRDKEIFGSMGECGDVTTLGAAAKMLGGNDTALFNPLGVQSGMQPSSELRPCGAIAASMFLDSAELSGEEGPVPISFDVASEEDRRFASKHFGLDKDGNAIFLPTRTPSWLGTSQDVFTRYIIWMRTRVSSQFRNILGVIDGGLPKGEYTVEITRADPHWQLWDVKRALVFSTASTFGGKNSFLGIGFVVMAAVYGVMSVLFLVVYAKARRAAYCVAHGD